MEKLFIPYELAVISKEKGFDEFCFGFYNCISMNTYGKHNLRYFKDSNFYSNSTFHPAQVCAPTYQQIVDWFEEKYKIEIYCPNYYKNSKGYKPEYECRINGNQLSNEYNSSSSVVLFETKKEALNKAIEEAFKLI